MKKHFNEKIIENFIFFILFDLTFFLFWYILGIVRYK